MIEEGKSEGKKQSQWDTDKEREAEKEQETEKGGKGEETQRCMAKIIKANFLNKENNNNTNNNSRQAGLK